MEITTRKIAKEAGFTKYFTGKPCKNGHIAYRVTCDGSCSECRAIYQHNNLDKKKVRAKRHYEKNSKKCKEAAKRFRENNADYVKEYNRRYSKENLAYFTEYSNRRYVLKKNRMPKWADVDKIKAIYEECNRISKETGVLHHVDHYYPLQGKTVSGLHVHFNLRIIPAKENLRKNNKHPDE